MVVVGLGPAGPDLLTAATLDALAATPRRYLRTTRHPAAVAVAGAVSFDSIYESASSLEDVYAGIVDALAEAAAEHGTVLYAVPGSPLVAERTVELLRADERVEVRLVPALSFLDLAWAALGVDPVAEGVRCVDGRRFGVEAAGERVPQEEGGGVVVHFARRERERPGAVHGENPPREEAGVVREEPHRGAVEVAALVRDAEGRPLEDRDRHGLRAPDDHVLGRLLQRLEHDLLDVDVRRS